jgi:PAS domain S-box-containing protein
MGQFFFDDEPIEYKLFRDQADRYGFKQLEYLHALDKVPRISLQKLDHAKAFFLYLSRLISNLSYGNIKLARAIAQQKKVEDELSENERLFRESQAVAHIGSYSGDLIQKTWKGTPAIYEIFGIDETYPNSFDGWIRCIHPDFREELIRNLYQNENKDNLFEHEYKIIRVIDGAERWVHGLGKFEYDNQMNPVRLIGTIQDITIRKQAEEALKRLNEELDDRVKDRTAELLILNNEIQQTEEKYRTVADHTYDWEYWISEQEDIYHISPSVERITGYSAEEFIANPQLLNQIVFPDDHGLWKSHNIESHIPDPDKRTHEIEFRIVTKTGGIRWIGHVCKGIFRDGKYLGLRVSNRDITERVKAENELLNVTVEVEERERNRFSLELHDDLGPLLSTIKLYFQWLSETDNPEKRRIITEKGNNSIERAIQTTREIAHGLGSQLVNNIGYVGAILQFIQIINDTQQLKIDFHFNSEERFSNFQEVILYRITKELINNTLKHSGATHVEIEFNHRIEKNIITFTYKDNGIGFDLEKVEKTNKGLGLINIQRKIKLMKGNITIETGPNKGIKVDVILPFDGALNSTQTKS